MDGGRLLPPPKSIPPRRLNLGAKCGPFLRGPAPEGNAPTPVIGFNMWHPITSTRSVIVIGLRGGVVLLGGVCLSTPGGVDFSLTEKKKTTGSPGPPNLQFPSALCTNVEMIIKLFFFLLNLFQKRQKMSKMGILAGFWGKKISTRRAASSRWCPLEMTPQNTIPRAGSAGTWELVCQPYTSAGGGKASELATR